MNKIFKVVWSKVKHCYVVVSEVAKNVITGSIESAKIGGTPMTRGLALGVMMAFIITGNAWAAEEPHNEYSLPSDVNDIIKLTESNLKTRDNKGSIIYTDSSKAVNPKYGNKLVTNDNGSFNKNHIMIYAGVKSDRSGFNSNKDNKEANSVIDGMVQKNLLDINNNLTVGQYLELYGGAVDFNNSGIVKAYLNKVEVVGTLDTPITLATVKDGGYIMISGALTNDGVENAVADNNHVNIENVIFEKGAVGIMGGFSRTGNVVNNTVFIKNTEVKKGYSNNLGEAFIAGGLGNNADNNEVTICGDSVISCEVYGGLNDTGTANYNTINIKDNADISKASLYGDNGGAGTGNTLNLETGWNGVVGSAENFNVINVGEGVEATFNESIVADEPNTVINIGYDGGDDNGEDGVKESLLIGQIITKESASSSLNFINGSAWKATGASNVSDLQGDVITIKVDKAEKDFVTVANNLTESQVVTLNVTKNEDVGVDVRTGVQGMLNTAVDDNGTIVDILNVDEITLKASVDTTVNNGQVENVVTTIKPGDKFVIESDVVATGDFKAGNVSLKETASQVDLIKNKNLVQDNRLDGIDAKNEVQDDRLDGIDAKNEVQDGRLDGIDAKNAVQDNRLDGIDAKNAVQDNRLDGIDAKNAVQDNRLDGIDAKNEVQDNRLDGIDAKNEVQDNRLAAVEEKASNQSARLDGIDAKNEVQDNRLDGIDAKNEVQDNRLAAVEEKASNQSARLDGIDAKNAVQDNRLDGIDAKNEVQDNRLAAVEEKASNQSARLDGIDAKNVAQDNAINGIDQRLGKMNGKINKVGAGAAALAALHPLDFDPDDKLSFSAGVGNYGGETATALGAFYRPNEKVMISAAGTMGNGENMVNMGVSFALDKTNNVSNSRTAMAREIVDLRAHVARQEQALARQDQQIAQLVAMVNQLTGNTMSYEVNKDIIFPDVPENHWAYEYIHSLAAKGIIEGYPDGNFDGDRTMTRYEFATMLYKAMQKGTVLNEQIRQEFSAELGRIRVDRIKGADSDTNKIERVRVNADVDRDDYGSK